MAAGVSRRTVVGGAAAALLGALGVRRGAGAQVTQRDCGNVVCAGDGCACKPGCVCCVYGNGNSRCHPPGQCGSGTEEVCPAPTTTTTAPPTTTTTTTTAEPTCLNGGTCLPAQDACLINGSCAETCSVPSDCPSFPACGCGLFASVEGIRYCRALLTCANLPQACTSTLECPRGQVCQTTNCGPEGADENRCYPLCPTTV